MRNADMGKAAGIIALLVGPVQMILMAIMLFVAATTRSVGRMLESFGMPSFGDGGMLWVALIFAYGVIVFGALLLAGARGMIPGIVLIVCALLGSLAGGTVVAGLNVLTLIAGIMAIMGSSGQGGDGIRGMIRTAQRMAEAAKETETKDTKD